MLAMFHTFEVFVVSHKIPKTSFTNFTVKRPPRKGPREQAKTKISIILRFFRIVGKELKSCGISTTEDYTILKLLAFI